MENDREERDDGRKEQFVISPKTGDDRDERRVVGEKVKPFDAHQRQNEPYSKRERGGKQDER